MIFKDRIEAGQKLTEKLKSLKTDFSNAVIYMLPRGGVVLGAEIAKALGIPLDLMIVRKIGHQFDPEYAIGAVAEDGHTLFNEDEYKRADKKWLEQEIKKEQVEAKRRREKYWGRREKISVEGKIAILVDDGIATGLSMMLAISEIKHQNPSKIIVAVPIVPKDMTKKIQKEAELVVIEIDENYLGAVGAYYKSFPQVEDEEVIKILSTGEI